MTAAELREQLDDIEQTMLASPWQIENLRPVRDRLRHALAVAEDAERRPGDPEAVWPEWQVVRCARRSRLSARQKANLIGEFGPTLYRSLPCFPYPLVPSRGSNPNSTLSYQIPRNLAMI